MIQSRPMLQKRRTQSRLTTSRIKWKSIRSLFLLFTIVAVILNTYIRNLPNVADNRVPIYNFPPDTRGQAEVGLRYSKRLKETTDPDTDGAVWAINYIRIQGSDSEKCKTIVKHVKESITRRRRRRTFHLSRSNSQWQIFLYDYADKTRDISACLKTLSSLLGGKHNIKYARRSLVDGRDFSSFHQKQNFNETIPLRQLYGYPSNYSSTDLSQYIYNGVVSKFHIQVRSDLLRELRRLYHLQQSHVRPGDVAHFWRFQPYIQGGALRNRVSEAISSLEAKNISILADTVSPRSRIGRNSVAPAYARALLEYKIIVVCQRDEYEDHFRLLEGMISGALVMSDPMVHMPPGYKHGENIVVYESIADLKQKIMYYLENTRERLRIARAGRILAVEQHRPWHRMERFILGQWPTSSDQPVIPLLQGV